VTSGRSESGAVGSAAVTGKKAGEAGCKNSRRDRLNLYLSWSAFVLFSDYVQYVLFSISCRHFVCLLFYLIEVQRRKLPMPISDLLNSLPHYVDIFLLFVLLTEVYLISTTFQEMAVPHLQVSLCSEFVFWHFSYDFRVRIRTPPSLLISKVKAITDACWYYDSHVHLGVERLIRMRSVPLTFDTAERNNYVFMNQLLSKTKKTIISYRSTCIAYFVKEMSPDYKN
jgi:hypothetical protein